YNHGELMHQDSIKYIDSLKVNTLRLGRPIYGGGGISPDLFVPLDTTEFTKYYRDVQAKGCINQFAIKYVDENRKELKAKYKNDEEFVKGFKVSDEMLSDLYAMAEKEGVAPNEEEAQRSRPLFAMVIKGLIGRDIFETATYFKIFNEYDPIFREAYRLIKSDEYSKLLSAPKE
ncbi:MAG: peptidase S41, partial [Muribaculaceae bacterium]|nr:peptidase S41 [Muribaculaceae bacterium]